jgi:N-acetyl-anhydromuramyl-L-alanine amidase AmpD
MKKAVSLLMISVLLLGLGGCGHDPAPEQTQSPTQPTPGTETTAPATQPQVTEPPAPVYVYEGAEEEYLLPLEDYSSEREFAPEYVMIHFTSAVVPHPEDPYNMDYVRSVFVDYNVSIHYIIDRDGTVRCYIPEDRVAWHAGKGQWKDDPKYTNTMNRYSIGIELVGMGSEKDMSIYMSSAAYGKLDDALKGFTSSQYDALKLLVSDLCDRYDIPMDREHVIGHQEYSPHKTDPGELFDWDRIIP